MSGYQANDQGLTEIYDGFSVILCYSQISDSGLSEDQYITDNIIPDYIVQAEALNQEYIDEQNQPPSA